MTGSRSTRRRKSCPPAASSSRNRWTSCSGQFLSGGPFIHRCIDPQPGPLELRSGAQGRALGDEPVEPRQGQRPDQAPVGLVGRVELLDLGDRGAAAKAGKAPDQLDVAEVPRRERVYFVAAEEAQT